MTNQNWPEFSLILSARLALRQGLRWEERIELEIERSKRYRSMPEQLLPLWQMFEREMPDSRDPFTDIRNLAAGIDSRPRYACIEVELHGGFDHDTLLPKPSRFAVEEEKEQVNFMQAHGRTEYARRWNLAQYQSLRRHIDDLRQHGVASEHEQKRMRLLNEWDKAFAKAFADWGIALPPVRGEMKAEKPRSSPPETSLPEFRLQGEYWTLSFDGKTVSMKDRAGMDYIAYLLRHPGQIFSCAQLVAIVKGEKAAASLHYSRMSNEELEVENLHVADWRPVELTDAKAMKEIKTKVQDLMEEIKEAEENNDYAKESELRKDLQQFEDYLGATTSLRSKPRKSPDRMERIRKTVTTAIGRSLDAIAEEHPSMGTYLKGHIDNRTHLVYNSDPSIYWQF